MLKNIFIYLFIFISFVVVTPIFAGSAVYTYTPGGGSSTDPGVLALELTLGEDYSSELLSFGINVPITQVESITIDSNNFHDYIITDEWANSYLGKSVVDGVTYYNNNTFPELLAKFSDDQNERVGLNFAYGNSSFDESSDDWVQSELLGKTITHMVINVKSYSKSTTDGFYNYSAEIDIEFHYGGETDSDSISSILDVGGNSDGTKGFMYLRGYHWVNSDWELLQEGTGQTGMDYRGQQYVVSTDDLSNWNKESPFKLVLSYINSAGIHYDSTYYLFGGTANPVFSYSIPDSDSDGVWDTFDVHQGFNDSLLDTYLTQNGYAKTSDISDLREGSVMIEVIDGIATIDLEMEVSDDLSSGSWIELDGSATMNIEADASKKFFRFKMAD